MVSGNSCSIRYTKKIDYSSIPVYDVLNNKVIVPLAIPDTISIDSIEVYLRAGAAEGLYFSKAKTRYDLFSPPRYFDDSGVLRVHPSILKMNLYAIPDSLLYGKDSNYYRVQLARFIVDSIRQPDLHPGNLHE